MPATSRHTDVQLTETIYAVTARTASGSACDLVLFARSEDATNYIEQLRRDRLPLGFDDCQVVEREVIGVK
jgi:hypothetical protein